MLLSDIISGGYPGWSQHQRSPQGINQERRTCVTAKLAGYARAAHCWANTENVACAMVQKCRVREQRVMQIVLHTQHPQAGLITHVHAWQWKQRARVLTRGSRGSKGRAFSPVGHGGCRGVLGTACLAPVRRGPGLTSRVVRGTYTRDPW